MSQSITIKSVPKATSTAAPRVQVGDLVFLHSSLNRAMMQAANAPNDSSDTYVVETVDDQPAATT